MRPQRRGAGPGAAFLACALAAACGPEAPGAPAPPVAAAPYAHVLIVSVDGLRPDAIAGAEARGLPRFARLLGGAATLAARTDPDWTVTLPNHVSMVTGRPVEGRDGHHWRFNGMPPPDLRVRAGIPSVFDAVAGAGGRCALFAAKEKFVLLPRTWNGSERGDPRGPIHAYAWLPAAPAVAAATLEFWEAAPAGSLTLCFAHFAECDIAGHAAGWDLAPGSAYARAVAEVDAALGALLSWLDARPERAARTALILTSDHGGGVPSAGHNGQGLAAANFTIPFLVWGGDGAPRGDLYALNPVGRGLPEAGDPGRNSRPPPLRSAEAANLALALLGLPALAGSTANAEQDLRWRAEGRP